MIRHFLALVVLACTTIFCAKAQNTVLKVDTAMTTHSSGGNRFSAIFDPTGNLFGSLMDQAEGATIAEDFNIPAGSTWAIDSVIVYGYQTGSTTTSSFTGGYAQIFNGTPGSGGAVVAGDTTTNRLAAATFSGIYRVDSIGNVAGLTRPIFRIALRGFTNTFAAGTYWVAYQTTGSITSGPWANPKVLPNGTNPPGQNARSKFTGTGNIWRLVKDSTSVTSDFPLGFNFMLKGRLNPTSVPSVGAATAFKLSAPYPNPASGTTNLSFSLGAKSRVSLRILNAVGQQVASVVEDEITAGEYLIPFSTANLAAGAYLVVLQTDAGSDAVPMTVK